MNIASLLIRARPDCRAQVETDLARIPGVEIAYSAADGPLIVTVEDAPGRTAMDAVTAIHRLPGVIAASLAYHYSDDFLEHA